MEALVSCSESLSEYVNAIWEVDQMTCLGIPVSEHSKSHDRKRKNRTARDKTASQQ
jgi:hypothetical protein